MVHLIDKDALVTEIERQQRKLCLLGQSHEVELRKSAAIQNGVYCSFLSFINTLEVKEVDIDKLCEFRKNIGFAYPKSISEYQKQLICYRQGIKDAIKAQKGEKV